MTDLTDIERRLEALERSNRILKIVAMLALLIALVTKLIVIWIVTTRPAPVAPGPPPRIAANGLPGTGYFTVTRYHSSHSVPAHVVTR